MGILTDVLIKKKMNNEFVIFPIDESCITPLGYDLRIGYSMSLVNSEKGCCTQTDKIVIPRKASVFFVSKELIWLSNKLIGTLHSRGDFVAKGLVMNSTTIDPNWRGEIFLLIHNISDETVELEKESPFATLILHYSEAPTKNEPDKNKNKVLKMYSDIYGESFLKGVNDYFAEESYNYDKETFKKLIDQAKSKTILFRVKYYLFTFIRKIYAPITSWRRFGILISTLLMICMLSLQTYWSKINFMFNSIPYDSKIFTVQALIVVSCLTLITPIFAQL